MQQKQALGPKNKIMTTANGITVNDTVNAAASTATAFHAKYYAHELSARRSSALVDRLTTSLFDAAVDLNPHQIEAALFALRSPLSKGVILADEVGLGKTIEAGILLCQYWAEHKRKLLVICPAVLRRQWSIELEEKFNLPSLILEGDNYAERLGAGNDPFDFKGVVIISFQFAARYAAELKLTNWNLVVIDEAHKLRNLYRPENKMGKAIQTALADHKKVLLTATPLQNSLLELYGLASLIDDRIFGGLDTFKATYVNNTPNLEDLKTRLKPFIQRTLRRQVLEYIRYTKREAITQPFRLTPDEQRLYDEISDFLIQPDSYAIPWAQRQLIVLIVRKLLASSAYAIIGTLKTIKSRLELMRETKKEEKLNLRAGFVRDQDIDLEYAEAAEEEEVRPPPKKQPIDLAKLNYEIEQIDGFIALARSIKVETKAKALMTALQAGFARMETLGAARKALVFTESSRTQRYLKEFLEQNGYSGKVVTFNGQNNDDLARDVYGLWLEKNRDTGRISGSANVDMRMALVDFFQGPGEVMIATEAAAEGINLQFCSLIVNYDLPWNPQRIEQRIGRCHRYGQKHDVVVINFLNEQNLADQRIYELLKEKFKLFDGVFGASDEILGRVESGIDFEKRILNIFETCRRPEEIEKAFAELQAELDQPIQERISQARQMLFDHFDEEVLGRLKFRMEATKQRIDTVTHHFWELTKYIYRNDYFFNDDKMIFGGDKDFIARGERPKDGERVPIYHYLETKPEDPIDPLARPKKITGKIPVTGWPYRMSDIMGESVIKKGRDMDAGPAALVFDLDAHPHKITLLEEYRGKSGWLWLDKLTIKTFEEMDTLVFTLCDDAGNILKSEIGEKLMAIPATEQPGFAPCSYQETIDRHRENSVGALLNDSEQNNHRYFNEELDKLDRWAEDLKTGLELELKQLDRDIKETDRQSKQLISLQEKLEFQKKKAAMEKRRSQKRHELFTAQDQVDRRREELIGQLEKQIEAGSHEMTPVFHIRWEII